MTSHSASSLSANLMSSAFKYWDLTALHHPHCFQPTSVTVAFPLETCTVYPSLTLLSLLMQSTRFSDASHSTQNLKPSNGLPGCRWWCGPPSDLPSPTHSCHAFPGLAVFLICLACCCLGHLHWLFRLPAILVALSYFIQILGEIYLSQWSLLWSSYLKL